MEKRKIRLLEPITHQRVEQPAGKALTMSKLQADWLIEQKKAEPVKTKNVSQADENSGE